MGQPVYTTLCGLSLLFISVPAIFHFKNFNVPILGLIFWIGISNLVYFINSIIWWNGDTSNSWDGAILCDITTKLIIGAEVGIPSSTAALLRYLADILSPKESFITYEARSRRIWVDTMMCFGPSLFAMGTHYIVQPFRFMIYGTLGCAFVNAPTWVTVVLQNMWPPFWILICAIYAVIVVFYIVRRRVTFARLLTRSRTGISQARFARLLLLSICVIFVYIPLSVINSIDIMRGPRVPYSWSQIHNDAWNKIYGTTNYKVPFGYYVPVLAGFICFTFFGTGKDALSYYTMWTSFIGLDRLWKRSGRSTSDSITGKTLVSKENTFSTSSTCEKILQRESYASTLTFPPQSTYPESPTPSYLTVLQQPRSVRLSRSCQSSSRTAFEALPDEEDSIETVVTTPTKIIEKNSELLDMAKERVSNGEIIAFYVEQEICVAYMKS
ncbi:Pheromone a factor receptor [Neolecta irregularis DAH-3]|uniref:Pheromone a factor receptor n=1 Tax=Neolecta irregularis (strain DAH-3) TaxID=1198029 RepID=A0A1U7LQJ8_NEOID|nr:Pheromone a factor receptor [Neolecta irregularis DAH-3]|eukprot:OLL24946.1 Pheromone a factor receptor [Neolecta irregularis DAH-3]